MRTIALVCCTLIAGLSAQQEASTDNPERYAGQRPRAFRQLKIPADEVARNVEKLSKGLHWHKTLRGSLKAASSKNKPVLWIQALGDLSGFL